jgi:hypothetical protein
VTHRDVGGRARAAGQSGLVPGDVCVSPLARSGIKFGVGAIRIVDVVLVAHRRAVSFWPALPFQNPSVVRKVRLLARRLHRVVRRG